MDTIAKFPKERSGGVCAKYKCCVNRLKLNITVIFFSSSNKAKVVCGNFDAVFVAKKKRYSTKGMSSIIVEELALDACNASLSIYVRNTLYAVPVLKFIWQLWTEEQ